MHEVQKITMEGAPTPKGPYAQAVRAGDFLFISGQGPIDPVTGEFLFSDIQGETKLTLENVERVLQGCGATRKNIVKCSVFLARAQDFEAMNEEYAEFFAGSAPARTTVGAMLVEPGMSIEIDCVAYLPTK